MVVLSAPPVAAADPSVETFCAGNLSGTTFTLTADCGPTADPLSVPDGHTLDGPGHTLSASDLGVGVPQFDGAVITNETPGGSMTIENLTVSGPVGASRTADSTVPAMCSTGFCSTMPAAPSTT
jgi:hypothetical protein